MRPQLVAAGAVLLAAGAVVPAARAEAEPGSGFGLFSLAANAPAVQLLESDPSTCFKTAAAANGCEGVVPEAVATLRSGPIGHGLAAVAWPGVLASGAGSLLITVGGSSVPAEAKLLNDPVRADAYTNVGSPTQTNDSVPGATMTASATPAAVSAAGSIAQSTVVAVGTVGSTVSRAAVSLTGVAEATATSHSEVKDVTVAGVVHIASVVSDASARTDGVTSSAKGTTRASGITVGGMAVTLDDRGVTALGTTASTGTEQDLVNSALSTAGITMALGAPSGKPEGGAVSYQAQSLVIVFTNPTGFTTTVVLGGANVSVSAGPGYAGATRVGAQPPGPGALPQEPLTPLQARGVPAPTTGVAPPVATALDPGPPRVLGAVAALLEPGPLPTRTVLLVLGAALLLAGVLRRLPDAVLRHAPVECLLEDSS